MFASLAHYLTPQKSNNQRARLLQPAGLTIVIAFFLFTQSTLSLFQNLPFKGFILGYASNISADQVIDQINSQRTQAGLKPLTLSAQLTQAAIGKANHMFLQNYWAHFAPDGTSPWVFIKNAGYQYSVAGENLARDFDTTKPMISAWMNSPTHQDNVLNSKYQDTGIAVVNGSLNGVETTLVVQMFGVASTQTAAAPLIPTQAVASEVDQSSDRSKANALTPQPESATLSQSSGQENSTTLISPLNLTKAFATAIVIFLMIILIYDTLIARKRKTVRLAGKNIAHFSFFAMLLLIILTLTQGVIL